MNLKHYPVCDLGRMGICHEQRAECHSEDYKSCPYYIRDFRDDNERVGALREARGHT